MPPCVHRKHATPVHPPAPALVSRSLRRRGLTVYAPRLRAARLRWLVVARQFRERSVRKAYVAVVHGILRAEEGEVDLPVRRNEECPPLQMVCAELGKPSLTKW